MNRREAIKSVGAAGLSLTASSFLTLPGSTETAPPKRKPLPDPSLPPPPGSHPKHDMHDYGIPQERQHIAMLVYPDMTALDLIGPQQIFAKMGNTEIHLLWKNRDLITTDTDVVLQPTTPFADCPDNLTILFVPGGSSGIAQVMNDPEVLDFLEKKARTSKYITSVGAGSLILGTAGLLQGYKATSHWMLRDFLGTLGAKPVKARYVEDRNRITGAGGTAGIDFALRVAARLRNEKMAKAMQLITEYDPQPPYHAGTPEGAPYQVTQMEWAMHVPMRDEIRDAIKQVRERREG